MKPELTRRAKAERLSEVRVLTLEGQTAREIAELVGVTERSVVRYRAELRREGRLAC